MSETDLEIVAKQAQSYYKLTPVIILGSGASAAFGMSGMGALANHLLASVDVSGCADGVRANWETCCALLKDRVDLETVLHKVDLGEELTVKVVQATWNLLNPEDLDVFGHSMHQRDLFPLGALLRHLLESTQHQLNIITPNYDRLAEYACEQEGIHHYTGFSYGYRRHAVPRDYVITKRQVNIWKVHGSLDWFSAPAGGVVCLGHSREAPPGLTPLIVTPGLAKYKSTHLEPFKTIIHEADNILDAAGAYLCVGFGFNDLHIQEKLVNRCTANSARVIVITYALSDSARKLLFDRGIKDFLAIERGTTDDSSVLYSSAIPGRSISVDRDLWSLKGFLSLVI